VDGALGRHGRVEGVGGRRVGQPTAKGRWIIGNSKLGHLTIGAARGLRDEHLRGVLRRQTFVGVASFSVRVVLGKMGIGSLDLHKAFTADGLAAAAGRVEIGRVGEEANGAFLGILVEKHLDGLAVDKGIVGELNLPGSQLRGGGVA
jgi:hypothetical protein